MARKFPVLMLLVSIGSLAGCSPWNYGGGPGIAYGPAYNGPVYNGTAYNGPRYIGPVYNGTAFNAPGYAPLAVNRSPTFNNAYPRLAQHVPPYGPAVPGLMNVPLQPTPYYQGPAPAAWPAPQPIRQLTFAEQGGGRFRRRHMNVCVRPGSKADRLRRRAAGIPDRLPQYAELAGGGRIAATPAQDLRYRGGKTIPNLKFVNVYVGGNEVWDPADRQSIDGAIAAAMLDENLNNVMRQYFDNQPISSQFMRSFFLDGMAPRSVSQTDLEGTLQALYSQGALSQFDLQNTVINFLLPQGTILTDATSTSDGSAAAPAATAAYDEEDERPSGSVVPHEEESSSLAGLGGYHGSIHAGGDTVYFTVAVYSETRSDGTKNGIAAFDQSWKNVVATLYHEMQEVRTDPDVEDATRASGDPSASRFLGWTSDSGEECGDFPIEEDASLSLVFQEVPLADGSGTVPIQLQYSNAVHGPEGPISAPHGASPGNRRHHRQDVFGSGR